MYSCSGALVSEDNALHTNRFQDGSWTSSNMIIEYVVVQQSSPLINYVSSISNVKYYTYFFHQTIHILDIVKKKLLSLILSGLLVRSGIRIPGIIFRKISWWSNESVVMCFWVLSSSSMMPLCKIKIQKCCWDNRARSGRSAKMHYVLSVFLVKRCFWWAYIL